MKLTEIEKKILFAFGSPFLKDTLKRLDTLFYAAWNDETKIVIRHLIAICGHQRPLVRW